MILTADQAASLHLGVCVLIVADPQPWRGHEGIVPLYRECQRDLEAHPPDQDGRCIYDCPEHDDDDCVLVGRGSIEVVPVTTEFLGDQPRAYLDSHGLWLLNVGNLPPAHGPIIKRKDLDPLPVPGRDFGIVIDVTELA